MLKPYDEMRKVDVKPYCSERDGMKYLNWAMCMKLLHDNGAEVVRWEPVPDPRTGSSLRMTDAVFMDKKGNTNRCYETRIRVTIDENVYEMQTPVMNGIYVVRDDSMAQNRVWNSMCRAFVKCVAINTGLGFDLWLDEESGNDMNIPSTLDKPASKTKIKTIQGLCTSHGIDADGWVAMNGKNWDSLTDQEASMMLHALKERYGDD